LSESEEPAVAVQYVSAISHSDVEHLYVEAEQVFEAIRPLAGHEKVRVAIVTAKQPAATVPASGLFSISGGAGWCWKQRSDGSWGPDDRF
jgi:hypothetical protein